MATPAFKKHLQRLKAESEQVFRLVSSNEYFQDKIETILQGSQPLRLRASYTQPTLQKKGSLSNKIRQSNQSSQKSKVSGQYNSKSSYSLQKEIQSMKKQNSNLSSTNQAYKNQIDSLKQQITKLQSSQKMFLRQKKEEIPFCKFQQSVDVFISTSRVQEDNYLNINYDESNLELNGSLLKITRQNSSNQFDIKQLVKVEYRDKAMILKFQPNSQWVYLNFQFNGSQKIESKLEICLYINWKIANSSLGKLFLNQFQIQQKKKTYRTSMPISQKAQQQQQSDDKEQDHKYNLKYDYRKDDSLSKQLFPKSPIFIQQQQIKSYDNLKNDLNFSNKQQNSLFNIQNMLNSSKKNQSLPSPIYEQKEIQDQQNQQRIIEALSQGYTMIKHAKGGRAPHVKQIYLIPQKMQLKFQDKDSKDFKTIDLKSVVKMRERQVGEGIKKHTKNVDPNLCLVIYLKGGKLIELTADTEEYMSEFYHQLRFVVQKILHIQLQQ